MDFWAAIVEFGWLQWSAVVFNVLYVIFAGLQKRICWIFGAIGVTLLFFIYVDVRLFSDALLQVFYLAMSVYGFVAWTKDNQVAAIRKAPWKLHGQFLVAGIFLTAALGHFWTYFNAALPYIDAATTAFSLIATFMVARRYIENWIYWIVIDLICTWVYIQRDLPLIALLFAVYSLLAVWGLWKWNAEAKRLSRKGLNNL